MRSRVGLLVVGVVLAGAGALCAAGVPAAVSPGSPTGALVEGRCPTFSWGIVEGAESYELVIYGVEEESEDTKPFLRQSFPGSVHSWTPSLESCLEQGGQYAWSVRAVGGKAATDWSAPSLFEVAEGPSEAEVEAALQIVRQYVAEAGAEPPRNDRGPAAGESTPPSGPQVSEPPVSLVAAAGDSDMVVNGAAVVTTATFGGAVAAMNRQCPGALGSQDRFTDCHNGTVRDNNTDLYWLKDASCAELGRKDWNTAQTVVASLADGSCGLTDGSQAGDWRQPTIREFCSAWSLSELIPCPASARKDSLISSSNSEPPRVVNPNPFVGIVWIEMWEYWSSSAFIVGPLAWEVTLANGDVETAPKTKENFIWPVRFSQ